MYLFLFLLSLVSVLFSYLVFVFLEVLSTNSSALNRKFSYFSIIYQITKFEESEGGTRVLYAVYIYNMLCDATEPVRCAVVMCCNNH